MGCRFRIAIGCATLLVACQEDASARFRIGQGKERAGKSSEADGGVVKVRLGALGCEFEIGLEGLDGDGGDALAEGVRGILESVEGALSVWRPDSDLADLNRRAAAEEVPVRGLLRETLLRCRQWVDETRGAFDPTVGALVAAYASRSTGPSSVPTPDRLADALACVGWDKVHWNDESTALRYAVPGLSLDLDGVSKGVAVAAIGRLLRASGVTNAWVCAGESTILSIGPPPSRPPRVIDILDERGGEVGSVLLRDASLSTSGNWRRRGASSVNDAGHLFDPRTGLPVSRALVSVTVLTLDAADSDAYATAMAVLGPECPVSSLPERTPMRVLWLTRDSEGNPRLRDVCNRAARAQGTTLHLP